MITDQKSIAVFLNLFQKFVLWSLIYLKIVHVVFQGSEGDAYRCHGEIHGEIIC